MKKPSKTLQRAAYEYLKAEKVKKGSRVRVVSKLPGGHEAAASTGWTNQWEPNGMDKYVGTVQTVIELLPHGIFFKDTSYCFPCFCVAIEAAVETVQLNSEYTAEIDHDLERIVVGCQVIPFSKVRELMELIDQK